jgi:hypothetical protein
MPNSQLQNSTKKDTSSKTKTSQPEPKYENKLMPKNIDILPKSGNIQLILQKITYQKLLPALIFVLLVVIGWETWSLKFSKKEELPSGCFYQVSDCLIGGLFCSYKTDCIAIAVHPTPIPWHSPTPTPTIIEKAPTPTSGPIKIAIKSVNWYAEPKKIKDLGYFTVHDNIAYYEMGTTDRGDTVYYVKGLYDGPFAINLVTVLKDNKNNVFVKSGGGCCDWQLSDNIKIATIDMAWIAPAEIDLNNNKFTESEVLDFNPDYDTGQDTKIGDTPYGVLYQTRNQDPNFFALYRQEIYLKAVDHSRRKYYLDLGVFNDDHSLKITFTNKSDGEAEYEEYPNQGGCGGPTGSGVYNDNTEAVLGLSKIGTYARGDVFRITDPANPLLKKMYEDYKPNYSGSQALLSYDEFSKLPTHFLIKDGLGDYRAFMNTKYVLAAECAKPVIYLYPTQTTLVSVKVDANVRVSEPVYPLSGWQAMAFPDGKLRVDGKQFDSLFWEGRGMGEYPDYHDYGVIVKQSEVKQTIHQQLSELGLNDKERSDFETFWFDRLPSTPFVRITWLMTQDMNRLAKLTVTPKPDTLIRVFMEFEGMQEPESLKPQKLTHPDRHGFTLVEWGGLLTKN